MKWFLGIMGAIFFLLFWFGILVEKINQRRKKDPVFDAKVTRIIDRIDPYYNFIYNVFGWGLAAVVFYFIYLG
jgi:hypothetical protein